MTTSAFLLETIQTPFGGLLLHLFTHDYGKICCSIDKKLSFKIPSPPALIELSLSVEKKGLYKASNIDIDDTFTEIRHNDAAVKTWVDLVCLIKKATHLDTPVPQVWKLLESLLPCLHLFYDKKVALFLVAQTLASWQGIDFPWMKENSILDEQTKKILTEDTEEPIDYFSMKCPEEGLLFLLEELEIAQKKDAKGGT